MKVCFCGHPKHAVNKKDVVGGFTEKIGDGLYNMIEKVYGGVVRQSATIFECLNEIEQHSTSEVDDN